MEINRNNYEAYLLDLMEGNLSMDEELKLREFLRMNPDCSLFPEDSNSWVLEKESLVYSGKDQLKKELPHKESVLSESNFDLFSIARMEGDLSLSQELEHEEFLEKEAEKKQDWALWQQARLQASPVEYPGKARLKKRSGIKGRIIWLSVISAAAVVALLFTLLRMEPDLSEMELAEEAPAQTPVTEDPQAGDLKEMDLQAETVPTVTAEEQEGIALADEPVLFSIKKKADRSIVPGEKGKGDSSDQKKDSTDIEEPKEIKSKPVRLASYQVYGQELLSDGSYDQIQSLDLPPSGIHMSSLSLAQISEIDLQEAFDAYTEEKNLSLWSIANAGIKGINKVTGSDISLLASRDEDGELSGFRLKSKRFSFTRPIDRREEFAE